MNFGGGGHKTIDKSDQRAAWVAEQNKAREAQAKEYNTKANQFNAGLSDYISKAGGFGSTISGLNIHDDEQFSKLTNQLNALRSGFSNYNFTTAAPNFPATVNSGISDDLSDGTVTLNVPTLVGINDTGRNSGMSQLQSAFDALNNLISQRKAEENRINSSLSDYTGRYSTLDATLSNLGLKDYGNQKAALAAQIAGLTNDVNSFQSSILDEYGTDKYSAAKTNLSALQNRMKALEDAYKAEQARNTGFSTNLLDQIGAQESLLGKLTYADSDLNKNNIDDKTDIENQLMALRTQARGYKSDLSPDLTSQLGEIESALGKLSSLRSARTTEEARIKDAQTSAATYANTLLNNAQGADQYNLSALQALRAQIANQRTQQSGFSTLLTPDWSGSNANLAQADAAIQALIDQRNNELSQLVGQGNTAIGGLSNIALEDETGLAALRNKIAGYQSQLSGYTGNDLADERAAFANLVSQLDTRTNDLSAKRADLVKQALALKNSANGQTFYTSDDISTFQKQVDALKALVSQYGATGADTYMADIAARLNDETARLSRDATNQKSAATNEANAVKAQLAASNYSIGANSQLTEDQILQLLAGIRKSRTPGVQVA